MMVPVLGRSAAIQEYSYITGTGPYTLMGATGGMLRFAAGYPAGPLLYKATDGANVEVVHGTFNGSTGLTRDTIVASSNGGAPINWSGKTRPLVWPLATTMPVPSMPQETGVCVPVGAVSFGGSTDFGWQFPAMADSPFLTMSVWLYSSSVQYEIAPSPQGNIFSNAGGVSCYLFNDPGVTGNETFLGVGGFQSWTGTGGTSPPLNDIINITRSNPAVMTFQIPHGITQDCYLTGWIAGHSNASAWGSAFTFTGADHITAVTATTITVARDTSHISAAWISPTGSNTPTQGGVNFQIFNSMSLEVGGSGAGQAAVWRWATPLPTEQWVNVLLSVDTGHPAGSKIAQLYFNDTQIPINSIEDNAPAFSIQFGEAQSSELSSWHIGGSYNPGGAVTTFMAEMWWAAGQFIDFSNPANRALFHNGTKTALLGVDGSAPTGTKPTLYLTQPLTPRPAPVRWIDPSAVWTTAQRPRQIPFLDLAAGPLTGVGATSLFTFSFWIDQHTVGSILNLSGTNSPFNGNIELYNGRCFVALGNNSQFRFSFPYVAGNAANIRVGIDMGHPIGAKIVNAYCNGAAAPVTVAHDTVNNLMMDWSSIVNVDLFLFSQGYIGDVWIAPGYFVDPGTYFYSAGAPGTLPPVTPAMYFHISGSQPADEFAVNLGSGGAFNLTTGSGPAHFSLLSATEFFQNASGNGALRSPEFMLTLELSPVVLNP